ncbi:MAG: phospho-N-acetylmuramoyl-pentapeptide-transferase [Clostridia bacterium]|nr:phospho-N-acetylmuramoyl-pentapeptide-transferase [Clostridia bacterium]
MIRYLLSMLVGCGLTLVLMPLVIRLSRRLKIGQPILSYVDNHKSKSGTPTMGGVGFIIAAVVAALVVSESERTLLLIALTVTVGYGIIGFLDDFIKVYFKRNEGLTPLQKLIFQVLIAAIVAAVAFMHPHVGSVFFVPFTLQTIDLSWFAIPIFVVLFLAMTNSVNLTDGLDGLASGVTLVYLLFFAAVMSIAAASMVGSEYRNLIYMCGGLVGALAGFICFNGYPAKIFMGDTGSLALGGGLACLSVMSRLEFIVPILGVMYVVSSLSVILQVAHFKRTRRRIFLMAPFHHHLEHKGVHENRIVAIYTAVTAAAGILVYVLTLALS